jgi:murein DD-endopeptidase MepM/ murein hydrolase activator NlpD
VSAPTPRRDRRWTILIVPHGTDAPRAIEIGPRAVRWGLAALAAAVLLAGGAAVAVFTPWGSPGGRLAWWENRRLQREIAGLRDRLVAVDDTLRLLVEREAQFRVMAGLAPADSAGGGPIGVGGDGRALAVGAPRRPFERFLRFGRGERPDVDALLARAGDLSRSLAAVSDTMKVKLERLARTPSIMPTQGWLSSEYSRNRYHPILHQWLPHEGIDLTAPKGTPIVAPAAATVKRVAWESGGYGNVLVLDHGNGIETKYAHCASIVVRVGQRVDRGQLIATVGSTGLSTGPHLHYEVHLDGKPVDPLTFVLPTQMP